MSEIEYAPSSRQFEKALNKVNLTSLQERLLVVHAEARDLTLTATELAQRAGYSHRATANAQYGSLGRLLGAALGVNQDFEYPVAYLVTFGRRGNGEITWILRAPLADAIQRMVSSVDQSSETYFPEEVLFAERFTEGAVRRVRVNAYERNPKARAACISKFGLRCCVCYLLMKDLYGEIGSGYIHVHHLKGLAEIRKAYQVIPEEDLRPVCPNCHAMLHTRNPPLSIDELRNRIRFHGGGRNYKDPKA